MQTYEQHFEASCKVRDEAWKAVGELDPDVIAHAINPAFMGGPRWPSLRQAFITVQCPDRTILASDGLSDPYDDMDINAANAAYNGFGLEVYTVAEKLNVPVQTTWQFQLAYQAAQLIAEYPSIINTINEITYMTTEFYNVDVPAEFINAEGRVGAFLNLPDPVIPQQLQLPLEPVKLVNVKLLTPAELSYVMEHGEEGRNKLAELLIAQGNPGLSSLTRPSVV